MCQGIDPTLCDESEENHNKFLSEHLVRPCTRIRNANVRLPPYTEMVSRTVSHSHSQT